ncbi:MAG TPA: glycosyltransferase family A protein [Edaphocola sp.]|nr:glycosyltransferase family A protein [Edaphocola sp.]
MEQKLPFFSVIITTYNRAALIERALYSLISQVEKDWQGIIIDDGSCDRTPSVIAPYLEKYPSLIYLRQENKGCPSAKNAGIILSSGRYISFLDSDDEYEKEHLKLRKTFLTKNPETELLHGGMKIIGEPFVPDRFDLDKRIHLNDCVVGGTFFIKRTVFNQIGNFGATSIGHDAEYFERAEVAGINIAKVNFPTYIYHKDNPDAMTNIM